MYLDTTIYVYTIYVEITKHFIIWNRGRHKLHNTTYVHKLHK